MCARLHQLPQTHGSERARIERELDPQRVPPVLLHVCPAPRPALDLGPAARLLLAASSRRVLIQQFRRVRIDPDISTSHGVDSLTHPAAASRLRTCCQLPCYLGSGHDRPEGAQSLGKNFACLLPDLLDDSEDSLAMEELLHERLQLVVRILHIHPSSEDREDNLEGKSEG
eukprot:763301-Hanusia_phi.AAC.4